MKTGLSSSFALRVVALALAAAAAWGPRLSASAPVSRLVLLDVSAGCDADAVDLATAAAGLGRRGRVRLATFGDGVVVAHDGRSFDADAWRALSDGADPSGGARARGTATDLAAALSFAATQQGGGDGGVRFEVVVFGDGRATSTGDELLQATARLRRAGCASLSFVRLPRRELGSRVRSVSGPGRVRRGGTFGVVVEGVSEPPGDLLELVRDGVVVAARRVAPGAFRVVFPDRVDRVGARVYEARVGGSAGERPARAHVVVGERGRGLLLSSGALRDGLAAMVGIPLDPVALDPEHLAARLATHDIVVVEGAVSSAAQRELDRWVRRGGGVMLLDGPSSILNAGGALAAASPLLASPPDDPGAFVYVAVDGSGSMAERWPGGAATRDQVTRAAVVGVLTEQPDGVTVAVRRFSDRSGGDDSAPWIGRPAHDGDALRSTIEAWPAPGGGTVLVPVLADAMRHASARTERVRRAVVFTDGRFADDPDELRAAVGRAQSSDVALTFIVDASEGALRLRTVLDGTAAEVVLVGDAVDLTAALRGAARARRDEMLRNAALCATSEAALPPGLRVPATAPAVMRRWAAPDAGVWVATENGAPVAAWRRHGEGRVVALATRPADPRFLPDGADAREMVSALRAAVERPLHAEARVQRDGERLLVRAVGVVPALAEIPGDGESVRVTLREAGGGLLEGRLPASAVDGGLVRLLDTDGAEVWTSGLDRPAVPEIVRERDIDPVLLQRLASGAAAPAGPGLRSLLAALAVLALLTAHALALWRRSSRRRVLPI